MKIMNQIIILAAIRYLGRIVIIIMGETVEEDYRRLVYQREYQRIDRKGKDRSMKVRMGYVRSNEEDGTRLKI